MRRIVPRSLLVLSLVAVALVGVGVAGIAWNDRADDICRKEAPRGASGSSVTWQWSEFAYVCEYRASTKPARRVGITEVFRHPGPRRRH
jgi:hypothetical protein